MTKVIIFRCDASETIGFGHAIRSFALAEECLARGFAAHFIATNSSIKLLRTLGVAADTIHSLDIVPGTRDDISATTALAKELNASWIVLDGYSFTRAYQSTLRRCITPGRLLVLDDGVLDGFDCDMILNQNLGAEHSSRYTEVYETELLLGSAYTLFRYSFREAARYIVRPSADKITLTFGGADPNNITAAMLGGLVRLGAFAGYSTRVIVGGAYRHTASLLKIPGIERCDVQLEPFSNDIIRHFVWSDLVVAAAGSVAWELALLRVPMALVLVADNQRAVAEPLRAQRAALILGELGSFDPDKAALQILKLMNDYSARLLLSAQCKELIDCYGARRVVDALEINP